MPGYLQQSYFNGWILTSYANINKFQCKHWPLSCSLVFFPPDRAVCDLNRDSTWAVIADWNLLKRRSSRNPFYLRGEYVLIFHFIVQVFEHTKLLNSYYFQKSKCLAIGPLVHNCLFTKKVSWATVFLCSTVYFNAVFICSNCSWGMQACAVPFTMFVANIPLFFPVNTNTAQDKEKILTLFIRLFVRLFVGKCFKHILKKY